MDEWNYLDTQSPEIQNCPEDIFKYAERNGQPVNISWEIPRATDNSEETKITQIEGSYPSSIFPVGNHKIVYSAADANGNISPNCSFYIRIQGKYLPCYLLNLVIGVKIKTCYV